MGRLFNERLFNYRIFNGFSAREARAHKIAEMNELIRKYGYSKQKLTELGYGDCLGEVSEYHTNDSGWESRSYKNIHMPSWMWQCGMKVGKNIPENKEIEEALGEDNE